MKNLNKSTDGFSAVELLLIVIILILIGFAGWFIYHTDHKQKTVNTTSNSSPTTLGASYLNIIQLGIKLPLGNNLKGAYYVWDGSADQAWVFSSVVDQYAHQQDPTNCTDSKTTDISSVSTTGGQDFQQIGLIGEGTSGPEGNIATITPSNGKTYTLLSAGSGCSSKQSVVNEVLKYQGYLQTAFAQAQ